MKQLDKYVIRVLEQGKETKMIYIYAEPQYKETLEKLMNTKFERQEEN